MSGEIVSIEFLAALLSCIRDAPAIAREGRSLIQKGKRFSKWTQRRLREAVRPSREVVQETEAHQVLAGELRDCNPERNDTSFEDYQPM